MLVLSRKENQRIVLQVAGRDDIEIVVCQIDAVKVRVGLQAPGDVAIFRKELIETTQK